MLSGRSVWLISLSLAALNAQRVVGEVALSMRIVSASMAVHTWTSWPLSSVVTTLKYALFKETETSRRPLNVLLKVATCTDASESRS